MERMSPSLTGAVLEGSIICLVCSGYHELVDYMLCIMQCYVRHSNVVLVCLISCHPSTFLPRTHRDNSSNNI